MNSSFQAYLPKISGSGVKRIQVPFGSSVLPPFSLLSLPRSKARVLELALADALHLEGRRERVHRLRADAVQADRELEDVVVVLAAGVDLADAVDDLAERDAAAEVADLDRRAVAGDLDLLARAHDELVDRVVDDLLQHHVDAVDRRRAVAEAADVHAGAQADVRERVEGLDRLLVVGDLCTGARALFRVCPVRFRCGLGHRDALVLSLRSSTYRRPHALVCVRSSSPIPSDPVGSIAPDPTQREARGSNRRELPEREIRAPRSSWGWGRRTGSAISRDRQAENVTLRIDANLRRERPHGVSARRRSVEVSGAKGPDRARTREDQDALIGAEGGEGVLRVDRLERFSQPERNRREDADIRREAEGSAIRGHDSDPCADPQRLRGLTRWEGLLDPAPELPHEPEYALRASRRGPRAPRRRQSPALARPAGSGPPGSCPRP